MPTNATMDFNSIDNAEAQADGFFELPLLPVDGQVLFPRVLSLIPLRAESQIEAVRSARDQGRTLIACKLLADPSRPESLGPNS